MRVVSVHYEGLSGSLGGYPRVTLRVDWGHFDGTLGSLWEYSGITLKVLREGHFDGTHEVSCQLIVTYLTVVPG